jgi:hypothetical protein
MRNFFTKRSILSGRQSRTSPLVRSRASTTILEKFARSVIAPDPKRYCSLKNNVLWTKKGQSCEAAAMWWSGFVFSFSLLVAASEQGRAHAETVW